MERVITETKNAEAAAVDKSNQVTVNAVVISHRGCVRDNNEDNFFFEGDLMPDENVDEGACIRANVTGDYHLMAVCDGMGGLKGGERASSIAVHSMNVLNQYFPAISVERAVGSYINDASRKVLQDSITQGEEGREGTTLALLYIGDGMAHVANVGDSRVYLLRMGKLYQLSYDDAPVFRKMKAGEMTREQMRKDPTGNRIDAYLGMQDQKKPKTFGHHFRAQLCMGDRFLLCSDGLSDLLSHDEIQKRLAESADPMTAANQLIWRALEMGGKDNTTVMIADVSGQKLAKATAASIAALPQEK